MATLDLTIEDGTGEYLEVEPSASFNPDHSGYVYATESGVWLTREQIKKLRKRLKRALAE